MICTKKRGFAKTGVKIIEERRVNGNAKIPASRFILEAGIRCFAIKSLAGYCHLGEHGFKLRVVTVVSDRQHLGQIHSVHA